MALYQARLSRDGGALNGSQYLLPQITKMADRSRENEMVNHIHAEQHLTVLCVMTYSKQVSKVTMEYGGLPTKITKGRKY